MTFPKEPNRTFRERMGMTGAWNSCVGYGCMFIALIFVIAAISAVCFGKH